MAKLLGAIRPDPHVFKTFPRIETHVDTPALPSAPKAWHDQDPTGSRYPMDGNDTVGDCVAAWIAHQITSANRFSDKERPIPTTDLVVPAADVLAWYYAEASRETGETITSGPGPGLDPVQATQQWKNVGFPLTPVSQVDGACTVGLTNLDYLDWCAWNFRGFGLAVELPDDYETTFEAPGAWQVSSAPDPDNGHMTFVGGYNSVTKQYLIYTWGTSKWATAAWVQTYGQYGIVPLVDEWKSIPGLNVNTLLSELANYGGSAI